MIKIGKYVYIHFTFVLLLAVGYINRNLDIIAVSYLSALLHELTHLTAALLIGLKPSHIALFPFGVNLKLKNTIVYGFAKEIILYLSGPLFNIAAALLVLPFIKYTPICRLFYYNNIGLFVFNMLPILPMDGGIVLKKVLACKIGSIYAEKILRALSAVLIALLSAAEVYLLCVSRFNFTVLFACVFLICNIFTNREKYNSDFTKELMFYKRKDNRKIKRVKGYLLKENGSRRELAKRFASGCSYVVFKENENGKIEEILTEREIIESLLK